jgi:hypothetical protein
MLADEVFDHTRTGGRPAGGYGMPAARRNVRRPGGYDNKCRGDAYQVRGPPSAFCRKVTGSPHAPEAVGCSATLATRPISTTLS